MGKNNYNGIEVYVSKLKSGTKFDCRNGAWSGVFIVKDGVPKIYVGDYETKTVSSNYVLNISTNEEIPFEAYVFKSVFYAQEFKKESRKLEELYRMINDVLLTEKELGEIVSKIESIIKNLSYLKLKFTDIKPENYH